MYCSQSCYSGIVQALHSTNPQFYIGVHGILHQHGAGDVGGEDIAADIALGAVFAVVTDKNRLTMTWKGNTIVDISREFLNSNGAEKHVDVVCEKPNCYKKQVGDNFTNNYKELVKKYGV